MRVSTQDLSEVDQLLQEVLSWSDEEVEDLPLFYRQKAKQYRELVNSGASEKL